jgi:hypothetical protein
VLEGRAQDADAKSSFGLFALLLGLSLILHQLWWDGFEVRSPHFLVILASLWVALRPSSVVRFLTMVALEVLAVALDMPEVGSHTLLVLVIGVCLLGYVAWTTLRIRGLPDAGALFERIAPFLRVQLLIVYAAAALAKLNSTFFDSGLSCAATMSRQVAWFSPHLLDGDWRVVPSIWGTVVIEVTLPLLLAARSTRSIGLMVGAAFHAILALAGNVPFSALALALYVAFLPPDAPNRVRALAARRPRLTRWTQRAGRWGRSPAAFFMAVTGWLAGAVAFTSGSAPRPALISAGTRLVVVAALCVFTVLLFGVTRAGPPARPRRSLRLGHPVFVTGSLLLVANCLSPYLGLKTESSFTMFSNLRTEEGSWNHLFLPGAIRVFPYQDRLVRITSSNDPGLEASTRDGTRLVRFELERYLRAHPGTSATSATTTAAGEVVLTTSHHNDRGPTPPFLERIFKFQTVPPPQRGGC